MARLKRPPLVNTVRQSWVTEERKRTLLVEWGKPKYELKQYMQVYCGPYEGHNFYVKDIRYNMDSRKWEYLYDGILMGGWYAENMVVPA